MIDVPRRADNDVTHTCSFIVRDVIS
jgi:hypothetical protein